jgi:hypothetical protein
LATLIRVVDDALRSAPEDRHVERFKDELGAQMIRHGPSHDTTAEDIQSDGEVQESGPCLDGANRWFRDGNLQRDRPG